MTMVAVERGDLERALKQLKRMMDNKGTFRIVRDRKQGYVKPSKQRQLAKQAAIKRRKKREYKESGRYFDGRRS